MQTLPVACFHAFGASLTILATVTLQMLKWSRPLCFCLQ